MSLEPALPVRRISVAIVDDEPSVRTALRRLCNVFGLIAVDYSSGPEFLKGLETAGVLPDCLVLDTQMPEMNGLEVLRHLEVLGIRLPTVVITADDAPEARARYRVAGVVEYLQKPVGADELFAAIGRAVGSV